VIISKIDLSALLHASHTAPHSVLGMHPLSKGRSEGVVVRAFLRQAVTCAVVDVATAGLADEIDRGGWRIRVSSRNGLRCFVINFALPRPVARCGSFLIRIRFCRR